MDPRKSLIVTNFGRSRFRRESVCQHKMNTVNDLCRIRDTLRVFALPHGAGKLYTLLGTQILGQILRRLTRRERVIQLPIKYFAQYR